MDLLCKASQLVIKKGQRFTEVFLQSFKLKHNEKGNPDLFRFISVFNSFQKCYRIRIKVFKRSL